MKFYDFKDISKIDKFKLLTGSVVPRPIAWISSKDNSGVYNIAPFSYFNLVSTDIPLISISIRKDNGITKDTALNIFDTKEFVVHVVSIDYLEYANLSSFEYKREVSEIEVLNLNRVSSNLISCDGVKEAKIRLECKYYSHLSLPTSDLIVGEVIGMHIKSDIENDKKINLSLLNPVSRLGGPNYGLVGKVIPLEKPKN